MMDMLTVSLKRLEALVIFTSVKSRLLVTSICRNSW